jgi:nicotinate-nucleotide adenylyltransferase
MRRIGILGGTFDPIHYGHLVIAEEVCWSLGLAYLSMMPAAYQPLKHGKHSASPEQRLHMVRLACADNPLLKSSDLELRRDAPSYTVDTLREMRQLLDNAGEQRTELWFVLGSDALAQLPRWHAAAHLIGLARLAIVARPGTAVDLAALETPLPGITRHSQVIEVPQLDISGSELRQRIAAGQPVRYQLPDSVLAYIREHDLYRSQ